VKSSIFIGYEKQPDCAKTFAAEKSVEKLCFLTFLPFWRHLGVGTCPLRSGRELPISGLLAA
jgi:hypothetical protein